MIKITKNRRNFNYSCMSDNGKSALYTAENVDSVLLTEVLTQLFNKKIAKQTLEYLKDTDTVTLIGEQF